MCVCVCVSVHAYLLCKAECCGRQMAGALACRGSWGLRYPPPGSVNGSESTNRLCGKVHHSPTPRCYTHRHTEKKEQQIFSMVPIMINYCWILHQTGELVRKKNTMEQIENARRKTDPKHFQVKLFFFSFCCVCKSTKLNEKRNYGSLCWNVILRHKKDWLHPKKVYFLEEVKMSPWSRSWCSNMEAEAQNGSLNNKRACLFWWACALGWE